ITTDAFIKGGLETNISGQVRELKKQGHRIYLVCGEEYNNDFIPQELDGFYPSLPLSLDASKRNILESIDRLTEIIQENNIDIVHIHPFVNVIPSYIAAWKSEAATVTTIHGP